MVAEERFALSESWRRLCELVLAQNWTLVLFLLAVGGVVCVVLLRWRGLVPAQHRRLAVFLIMGGFCLLAARISSGEWAVFPVSLLGGGIGIWLANRRASAMVDNVRLNRFKDAVGMLAGSKSSVLVGAVYALHEIAEEDGKLRRAVFHILCEFVRKAENGSEREKDAAANAGLVARQTALQFLFGADGAEIYGGRKARLAKAIFADLDLSKMNFTKADLTEANLKNSTIRHPAIFAEAELKGIQLLSGHDMGESDLSHADMRDTNFLYVHFEGCNFAGTKMRNTSFVGCFFFGAKNLTYAQLESAKSLRDARGLPQDVEKQLRRDKPELFGENPQ